MRTLPTFILPVTKTEVISGYTTSKKRKYKLAREMLHTQSRWNAWSAIRMFVKPDRYSAISVYQKAPRAIQYRHSCFNLKVATYLKPYEHAIYNLESEFGLPMVAKGKNNIERAMIIKQASACFRNPVYILADHSKFDSCVNVTHLKFLHNCYKQAIPDSSFLMYLLSKQLHNRGYSAKGNIHYTVEGTRMSGDFDTGLGNTLLNLYITFVVFRKVKYHVLLDGDDSVVVMEKADLALVNTGDFRRLGFDTKFEVVTELHDVEFCRARFMDLDPPRFARDPVRALANMTVSSKHYVGEGLLKYLAGLGLGEASASNGVPIIGPIAAKLSRLSSKPILDENIKYMYGAPGDPEHITDEARLIFQQIYGWSPAYQIALETQFKPQCWVSAIKNINYYNSLPLDHSEFFPC